MHEKNSPFDKAVILANQSYWGLTGPRLGNQQSWCNATVSTFGAYCEHRPGHCFLPTFDAITLLLLIGVTEYVPVPQEILIIDLRTNFKLIENSFGVM